MLKIKFKKRYKNIPISLDMAITKILLDRLWKNVGGGLKLNKLMGLILYGHN